MVLYTDVVTSSRLWKKLVIVTLVVIENRICLRPELSQGGIDFTWFVVPRSFL